MHRADLLTQAHIKVSSRIERTPRVQQVEGLFDLQPAESTSQEWNVYLPLNDRDWNIGLIVGPSGCGKSTIARTLWPAAYSVSNAFAWSSHQCILDHFPDDLSVKDVVYLLSSVGFSSPPAWLRPYHVLSTGQAFRVTLARLLAEAKDLAVMDEFTSVVDRTVAQIGSAAIAKTVRQRKQKFVAVTCHEDVEPWLNPDWVYRPDVNQFTWRSLQQRPAISLQIQKVHRDAWKLFKHHHYLDTHINPTAQCWVAWWNDQTVAFTSWIHSMSNFKGKREHRTVTLPDYQGVGIGHALSTHIAAMWKALGFRASSTTTHPAFIAARRKDPNWIITRNPSFAVRDARNLPKLKHATTRLTAGFEYVGQPLPFTKANALNAQS